MDWLVLLPPLVAIALALMTRQIYLSLLAGLLFGTTLLAAGNPLLGVAELFNQLVSVFADAGNTRILMFCLMVGGLIALLQAGGGVQGFVHWATQRGLAASRRGAELLAIAVGLVIFVESSITSLAVGASSRPLFDRLKLPREKLAYYCDATSAPVCMMLPLNGWGAYVLGLLAAQGFAGDAVSLLIGGLAYNFFAWLAIGFALFLAFTGWSFGPMRAAEQRAAERGELIRPGSRPMVATEIATIEPAPGITPKARYFCGPILLMVVGVFAGLLITGEGNLTAGSGSTSVLWAVSGTIVVTLLWYRVAGLMPVSDGTDLVIKGMGGLVGPTVLLLLAFALGQVSRALEIGPFLVSLMGQDLNTWWLPGLVFVIGCAISFTLGSSWTTFAILLPLALPLAEGLGLPPALMLGAVLSGGIFGDHVSPLSDTSIISSMAAACDHVDHINTQLPYALLLALLSLASFLLTGLLM